jgi:hypothetical protein
MSTNPCEKDRQNQPPIQLESLHNLPFSRRQFTAAPIFMKTRFKFLNRVPFFRAALLPVPGVVSTEKRANKHPPAKRAVFHMRA